MKFLGSFIGEFFGQCRFLQAWRECGPEGEDRAFNDAAGILSASKPTWIGSLDSRRRRSQWRPSYRATARARTWKSSCLRYTRRQFVIPSDWFAYDVQLEIANAIASISIACRLPPSKEMGHGFRSISERLNS